MESECQEMCSSVGICFFPMKVQDLIKHLQLAAKHDPACEVRLELLKEGQADSWSSETVLVGDVRATAPGTCEVRLVRPLELAPFLEAKDEPSMP